jgi:hypothetical protein
MHALDILKRFPSLLRHLSRVTVTSYASHACERTTPSQQEGSSLEVSLLDSVLGQKHPHSELQTCNQNSALEANYEPALQRVKRLEKECSM